MGLLNTLKNIFNLSKEKAELNTQLSSQECLPKIEETCSFESVADETIPDIIPLNVLLKRTTPTKRGLYPHEILMLDYAHTFSTESKKQDFQGFWYYEYSVEHPEAVLKSLETRNFIRPGDLQSTVQHLTVSEIKQELKTIGQKVSGKKSDLIARLLDNVDLEKLNQKFPVRFYTLTESGQQELSENEYVPYLHRHRYMSVWEMNHRLANNPKHLRYRDLIWQFFNEESLQHLKEGNMGFYRNTRLNMYQFLMEEQRYGPAFNLLCEVIAYDLSGMDNNEFYNVDEDFRLQLLLDYKFPYDKSSATLPPAIKQWLPNLQRYLNLSDGELRQRLFQQFESIHLYRHIFTNVECVDIVMAELIGDISVLKKIYRDAEIRIQKQLKNQY